MQHPAGTPRRLSTSRVDAAGGRELGQFSVRIPFNRQRFMHSQANAADATPRVLTVTRG
eukprot:COSAG02_NODE_60102_length_272_cov_0.601156_1_plen_58_part_01